MFTVKRARRYYLYDTRGQRLIDCCLTNGNAIFGHNPSKLAITLKQAINKGVWDTLPTCESSRAIKHLNNYLSPWKLLAILQFPWQHLTAHYAIQRRGINKIHDMTIVYAMQSTDILMDKLSASDALLWRPYSHIDISYINNISVNYLCTPLPIGWQSGIIALYGRTDSPIDSIDLEISPVLLSAINYIIPYMIHHGTRTRPFSVEPKNRKDIFILDNHNTKLSRRYSFTLLPIPMTWKRQGIYIVLPEYSHQEYLRIREIFFEQGFYFPNYDAIMNTRIIVLPPYMNKNELELWDNACLLI